MIADVMILLLPAAGLVLTGHSLRMAWRELRTGTGSAALANYPRPAQLAGFLMIIFVHALAALTGLFFTTVGLLGLMVAVKG